MNRNGKRNNVWIIKRFVMKTRYTIGIFIGCMLFCACAKDVALGPDVSFEPDYVLPQGGDAEADKRIVELYEKYGSYFLYDFTVADLNWNQVANSTSYKLALGDPKYAGDMLDLLEDVWLQFYPEEFLKKNLPYRIFMADTIYWVLSYMDRPITCAKTGDNSLAFGYMNADTKNKTVAEKVALKNEVQTLFFEVLRTRGAITIPEEFYKISDYAIAASADPNSDNYARKRGFVANPAYGYEWCTYVNWQTKTLLSSDDLTYFLGSILQRTTEQWANDLTYPLVKQKYDILVEHFKKEYNIDLKKIGNATY